jgi:hypothetical protein
LRAPTPSSVAAAGARLDRLPFDVTDGVTVARRSKIEKIQQNQSCNFVTDGIGMFLFCLFEVAKSAAANLRAQTLGRQLQSLAAF